MDAKEVARIFAEGGKMLNGARTLAELRSIDPDSLRGIYAVSYDLYENGKYADAAKNFELLCLYDHENPDHWIALGHSREALRDYQGAAAALYVAVVFMDEGQATVQLAIAENLMASGDGEGALGFLDEALAGELDDDGRRHAESLRQRIASRA